MELGVFDTPDSALDVEVVGDLAYVAAHYSGLRVIDVSNPASPVELGAFDIDWSVGSVEVVGDLAYVGSGLLRVIDVSNPHLPVHLGALGTPDRPRDVTVVGELVYVAANESGLRIMDFGPEYFAGDGDGDGDGVDDYIDNCSEDVNTAQDDTDCDGYGNICDADYDQSGIVGFPDFGQFVGAFGSTDMEKCHNEPIPGCTVGFPDFGAFVTMFGRAPGPSGTTACP